MPDRLRELLAPLPLAGLKQEMGPGLQSRPIGVWLGSLAATGQPGTQRADTALADTALAQAVADIITPAEAALAARIADPLKTERRRLSFALVRLCVADYLGVGPATVVIDRADNRTPTVSTQPKSAQLKSAQPVTLSVTHTGPWLAVAVTAAPSLRIGIDLEQLRPRDFDPIAALFMAPDELVAWRALAPTLRETVFYRVWTAKEALFKAGGLAGTSAGVAAQPVTISAAGRVGPRVQPPHTGHAQARLYPFEPRAGLVGTLAAIQPQW